MTNKNSLTLNGVEIELTAEQAEKIKQAMCTAEAEPQPKEWRRKPYVAEAGFCIDKSGDILRVLFVYDEESNNLYSSGNFFPRADFTEEEVEQINLAGHLNRLLKMYAHYHNDVPSEEDWKLGNGFKRYIVFDWSNNIWVVDSEDNYQIQDIAYFKTEEIAEQAIRDVVKPFLAAHSKFEGGEE